MSTMPDHLPGHSAPLDLLFRAPRAVIDGAERPASSVSSAGGSPS